jgi:hypothetical protein
MNEPQGEESTCRHCRGRYPKSWDGFPRFFAGFCSDECRKAHIKEQIFADKSDNKVSQ